MTEAQFIKAKSFTDPDMEYIIRKMDDGYRCSCPDFVIRDKKCKHIKRHQHLKYKK